MNDYSKARWEKLSAILGDEAVPLSERMDSAFDMLEAEIREAFGRGTREAGRGKRAFQSKHSRDGQSAVQAGVLTKVGT